MVISQMCPEAGALAAFFPFDLRTAEYLEATKFLASSPERLAALRHFRQKSGLFQVGPRTRRVINLYLVAV
jgi:aconitase A